MRLWTINRAFSPGVQRLGGAAWTGDIEALWPQLERTPTDLLNWGLAGMPYTTCDIGGFRDETTPELLTRWIEAGVFFPILRTHSRVSVQAHFPWLFGPEAEGAIRKALDLRYRLIPYYYSLAHETHDTGVPLMRPLMMEFPQDPNVANLSDQWLMGDGLMAAPILSPDGRRSVYLPAGDWYDFDTNTKLNGGGTVDATASLDQIPVYVHEGTILPLGPVIQHTDELPGGPLELQVYPGKDATFTLVEDDGVTTAYLKGEVRQTTFTWNDAAHRLSWRIRGPYRGKDIFTSMNIKVFYPEGIKQATASLASGGSLRLSPQ
jgi:alpha-glucosidase